MGRLLDAIDESDPIAIAAIIGETLQPPRLTNTDGQDLVVHNLRWRCPSAADVDAALVTAGLSADADGRWTLVRDTAAQTDAIVAHLELTGDELTGDANSNERAAELLALVARALPDAELLGHDRRSAEEFMANRDPDAAPAGPELDARDA